MTALGLSLESMRQRPRRSSKPEASIKEKYILEVKPLSRLLCST
jgi:hypothetical protein